ncbi:uncharacterized protein LOC111029855 [Myzus persicae]|uniref:uncharacterized protein LOC111029855 n=1 Tax=Myzus persicae TaxID=13164 RepID=UPI000B93745C|nr:uncharacterized protein LOC111029855 [Myzus persicae]
MTETNLEKISFFKLLNLETIAPENDSPTTSRDHLLVLLRHNADLKYKNNSIKTGYENFCIKKGTLKLLPLKDFDFICKQVVCQKCCQKFASKLSYKAHVGTDICVRTYDGPNLIYLKFKNRKRRHAWTPSIRKSDGDFGHNIQINSLNPEMLNTLQTRNKVYSDKIFQKNKVKEKPTNYSDKKNDGPFVKKPRGRPKKNNISNNAEVNLKKLGRPEKLNAVSVYSSNQNDNRSNSDQEIDESEKTDGKLQSLSFIMKETLLKLGEQENDSKLLLKKMQGKKEYPYIDELKLRLTKISEKHDEIKPCKLKKTDTQGSIPDEGKANIQRTFKNNENESEIEMNTIDFDENEKSIGILIDNNTVHAKISKELNNGCESIIHINEDMFGKESISKDSFEDNSKTVDRTPNITNSVEKHKNDSRLNCIYNTELNCRKHRKTFKSVAEWKLHSNEHSDKLNEIFLCTICGLKFKVYKNYKTHLNNHKKNKTEQKCLKRLLCKRCYKQYDFLSSYYTHIKTHVI